MNDETWVIRTLRAIRPSWASESSWEQEITVPVLAWARLAASFNISWSNQRLTEIFGSVLARLPEENFLLLFQMRNLFFFFSESLSKVHGFHFRGEQPGVVVVFSPDILRLTDTELAGVLIHELCHLLLRHYAGEVSETRLKSEIEREADEMAVSLGFGYEIQKIRERLNSRKEN